MKIPKRLAALERYGGVGLWLSEIKGSEEGRSKKAERQYVL
jgi:hypothetical protein